MTDQPTLRDRIRRVLAEADGFSYDCLEPHDYQRHADAILTLPEVLSTPVDRAAVLGEAADAVAALIADGEHDPDELVSELRRMADEAQQPACGNCGHPAAWHDPWEGCVGPDGIGSAGSGDCTCTRSPDEAQQPEEAHAEASPVCQGFQWIGQSFATCERCGQPAWEHAGEEVVAEWASAFPARRTVRPWKPGEADAIRAKWSHPAP